MPTSAGTMSEVPQYAEIVVQSLSSSELFEFSAEARQEIDLFYSQINIPDHALEQSRALSLLHAAEYALLPAFVNPGQVELPPNAGAIMVSAGDARLALLKGDCSLIVWTHIRTGDRIEQLQPSDLMVFSADVSKARSLGRWDYNETVYDDGLQEYASTLDSLHQQSGWEPAVQVTANGAILLQGFLWNLKLAVVKSTTNEEFVNALRRAQTQEMPFQEAEPQAAEHPTAPLMAQLSNSRSYVPRVELNQDGTINLVVNVWGFDPGAPIEISGHVTQDNGAVATFYNVQQMPQNGSLYVARVSAVPPNNFVAGFPITVVARAAQVWITTLEADTDSGAFTSRVFPDPLQAAWKAYDTQWAVSWPGQNAPALGQSQPVQQSPPATT